MALLVYLKKDQTLKQLQGKNKKEIEKYKDNLKKKRHENIIQIRDIIKSYENRKNIPWEAFL